MEVIYKIYLAFFLSLVINIAAAQDQQHIPDIEVVSASKVYEIVSNNSLLRVYISRAGLLSNMGHNHVITSRDMTGYINYVQAPEVSSAGITIPVESLIVDDAAERRQAGNGYETVPSDSDIQGTRQNMLSDRVLDAENHPLIRINIEGETINYRENPYKVQLTFRGNLIPLEFFAMARFEEDHATIDANFILEHAKLGLKPFSVLGGMLRVGEQLRIELHIEAISD